MNKRNKNNPPVSGEVVILALCIVLVMITLSQILVVHHKFNGRFHARNPRTRNNRNRVELRQLEKSIAALMRQNVPTIEQHGELLRGEVYASRTSNIILRAMLEAKNPVQSKWSESYNYEPESVVDDLLKNSTSNVIPVFAAESLRNDNISDVSVRNTVNKSQSIYLNKTRRKNTANQHKVKLKQFCSLVPKGLLGAAMAKMNHSDENIKFTDILQSNQEILSGGQWRPSQCVPRYRVAIIIPYRDRLSHLVILLAHLLPVLQRQDLDFRIFVVEQHGTKAFNKGRIMNAAFKEALKIYDFQCAVFHDVDLIPEDDRNMYSCPDQPRHLSVAIDEMNYKLSYDYLVGGVLNMRTEHYFQVNGYSNMYVGWGAEDDDMAYRILHVGLKISRPPENVARYKMMKHAKRKPTVTRYKLLNTAVKRYKMDGLNSAKYDVVFMHNEPLYTHIMVDISME